MVFYDALKIIKQRTENGKMWYIIRWADPTASDSWSLENDDTDLLNDKYYETHTKPGKVRKRPLKLVALAVINELMELF